MKRRCYVFLNGSEHTCSWPWRRRSGFHTADITKKKKQPKKHPQCLPLCAFAPSGKDFLILLPSVTSYQSPFFSLFCLTSPGSLICYTSGPTLVLFALCSPLCKVVIRISPPRRLLPLYLSNYLSALSSRPTPSSTHLPLCKISPSALTFILSHSLPFLISPA